MNICPPFQKGRYFDPKSAPIPCYPPFIAWYDNGVDNDDNDNDDNDDVDDDDTTIILIPHWSPFILHNPPFSTNFTHFPIISHNLNPQKFTFRNKTNCNFSGTQELFQKKGLLWTKNWHLKITLKVWSPLCASVRPALDQRKRFSGQKFSLYKMWHQLFAARKGFWWKIEILLQTSVRRRSCAYCWLCQVMFPNPQLTAFG